MMSGNDWWIRNVFSCRQKEEVDGADCTSSGRVFQKMEAATGNEQRPAVDTRYTAGFAAASWTTTADGDDLTQALNLIICITWSPSIQPTRSTRSDVSVAWPLLKVSGGHAPFLFHFASLAHPNHSASSASQQSLSLVSSSVTT